MSGIASVVRRGPLQPVESTARAGMAAGGSVDAILPANQSACGPGAVVGNALTKPENPR